MTNKYNTRRTKSEKQRENKSTMLFASVSYTHQWTASAELNTVQHNLTSFPWQKE